MHIERALRMIAGIMVLLGTGLTLAVGPYGLLLPAFVGLNLLQSAFTNWCPMVTLLERLGLERCSSPASR